MTIIGIIITMIIIIMSKIVITIIVGLPHVLCIVDNIAYIVTYAYQYCVVEASRHSYMPHRLQCHILVHHATQQEAMSVGVHECVQC